MLRIEIMKNETPMTPTKIPRILPENQMPPKKQKGLSIRKTAGEPPCKKVLFAGMLDSDSDDEEREVIKPWDSQPTRDLLISMVKALGKSRAKPETHTAFMLLGDFKDDDDDDDDHDDNNRELIGMIKDCQKLSPADDDKKEMSSSKATPMTLTRLTVAQQFCAAVGDKMGCKHKIQYLDITSTYFDRMDMMIAVHKEDVESMDASKIAGRLVNAELYYADKGKTEWSKEFIAKNSAWLDGGLTAHCIAVYRRGDIENNEKLKALIKEQEEHPMQYLCGFDKAGMLPSMWESIIRVLDIPVDSVKRIPFAMDKKKSSFHWIGKDIEIMTEHNPLTGEAFDKKASSEGRIGFAGYVGVRCKTKAKRDLVLALFGSMPNIFGGESKDSLEYIGFHGCDGGGGEKRKREAATDKKGKTKTTASTTSAVPLKRRKLNKINVKRPSDPKDHEGVILHRNFFVSDKVLIRDMVIPLMKAAVDGRDIMNYEVSVAMFCDYANRPKHTDSVMMPTTEHIAKHMDQKALTDFINRHFSKEALIAYVIDRSGCIEDDDPVIIKIKAILTDWRKEIRAEGALEASQST